MVSLEMVVSLHTQQTTSWFQRHRRDSPWPSAAYIVHTVPRDEQLIRSRPAPSSQPSRRILITVTEIQSHRTERRAAQQGRERPAYTRTRRATELRQSLYARNDARATQPRKELCYPWTMWHRRIGDCRALPIQSTSACGRRHMLCPMPLLTVVAQSMCSLSVGAAAARSTSLASRPMPLFCRCRSVRVVLCGNASAIAFAPSEPSWL